MVLFFQDLCDKYVQGQQQLHGKVNNISINFSSSWLKIRILLADYPSFLAMLARSPFVLLFFLNFHQLPFLIECSTLLVSFD